MPGFAILVGGASSRFFGEPKGLLLCEGEPVLSRLLRLARELEFEPVLIGDLDAYDHFGVERLPDADGIEGPVAGLISALRWATLGAIVVSCDLPFLTVGSIRRVYEPNTHRLRAFRRSSGLWEPFPGWYPAGCASEVEDLVRDQKIHSFQKLLTGFAEPVALDPEDARSVTDWDSPEDRRSHEGS